MTTILEVRNALVGYLVDYWTSTPISLPNRLFVPKDDAPNGYWVSPKFIDGRTFEEEKGTNAVDLRTGILRIYVHCLKDDGIVTGLTYCAALETLFRKKSISNVETGAPYTIEVNMDDSSETYFAYVDVPYFCFSGCT